MSHSHGHVDSAPAFAGTDRFEVVRTMGAGAMGVVYEALDREAGVRVALKTLRYTSADLLFRLKREFRAARDLRHPNLVALGELVEDAGRWFFTMELVDGVDFVSYAREASTSGEAHASTIDAAAGELGHRAPAGGGSRGPAPGGSPEPARLTDALVQLVRALNALHGAGQIHRDVKPSNVRVTPEGRVVLLDFGLVTPSVGTRQSRETNIVGTAAYMAPEQATSGPVGPAADWYSVGVMLFEALSGALPFDGMPMEILSSKLHKDAPRLIGQPGDDLDLLRELAADLLKREPGQRPTASEVLRRLGAESAEDELTEHVTALAPFVGRDNELAALCRALDDVRAGRPVTTVVSGESGLGKTALLRRFVEYVNEEVPDGVVLSGRCYRRESVPYKALDGVVDALAHYLRERPEEDAEALLGPNAALLRRVFPTLGRVPAIGRARLGISGVQDAYELRLRAFAGLRHLISELARQVVLVVSIEDVQWADADSMVLLEALLAQPAAPTLLLVATSRPVAARDAGGQEAPSLPAYGELRRVELGELAPAAAHDLAAALLAGVGGTSFTAEEVVREARGHPLHIGELVRYSIQAGHPRGAAPHFDEMVLSRTDAIDADAARVLEIACLSGAPLPRSVVRDAVGLDDSALAAHLDDLRLAGLIHGGGTDEGVEPYHDRVREAILSRMSDEDRRGRHLEIARALEASGTREEHTELLVRHFHAAGQDESTAYHAEVAAERARAAFAFDRAAELYRLAVTVGQPSPEREGELQWLLGHALADAGRGPEAAAAYLAAARSPDPARRLECRKRAAEQYLISGHLDEGLTALERVLNDVGESLPKTPRRALLSLLWLRGRLAVRGRRWKERHESEIPAKRLALLDAYSAVAVGLGIVDPVRSADFQARGLLGALQTGEKRRVARLLCYEAVSLAMPGGRGIAKGRKLLEEAREIADGARDPHLSGLVAAVGGMIGYFEGAFADASRRLELGEQLLREGDEVSWGEINVGRTFRVFCSRMRGAIAHLGAIAGEFLREAEHRGDRYSATTFRRTAYLVWLAQDDPGRVRAELDDATWVPPEGRFHLQHYFGIMAEAELRMYRGEIVGLRDYVRPGLEQLQRSLMARYVQITRAEAQCLWGRVSVAEAMAGAERDRALADARAAARRLRGERIGYARVWGALLAAGVDAVADRRDAVAGRLRETIELAERHDMPLYAAAARFSLATVVAHGERDELYAASVEWARAEGVVDFDRLFALIAPGFARDARA